MGDSLVEWLIGEVDRLRADLARVTGERDAAIASALATQAQATKSVLDATARAEAAERERAEVAAHELEKREHERTWQQKVQQIERAEAAEKRAEAAERERDAAIKQQRHAWDRHAEKDRAYGDMIKDRDHWRTVAESRPDISREDAGKAWAAYRLRQEEHDAAFHRVGDALRAHATAPKGDDGEAPEAESENRRVWWCPHCEVEVPPTDVTFVETHDTRSGGCGHSVESIVRTGRAGGA